MKQPAEKAEIFTAVRIWLLRRTWEVDERHLLLGLLEGPESPEVVALTKQGLTLEAVR